jgi:hypothetical protein
MSTTSPSAALKEKDMKEHQSASKWCSTYVFEYFFKYVMDKFSKLLKVCSEKFFKRFKNVLSTSEEREVRF